MNIFMAAVYSNSYMPGMNRYVKLNERERDAVVNIPHILESWHYVGKQSFVDHMRNNSAQIFLDSGAFSAYTLGVSLSVNSMSSRPSCSRMLRPTTASSSRAWS